MKKETIEKLVFAIITLSLVVFLFSCNTIVERSYYSKKENYVNATGIITYISYNEDKTALYLDFSELTPTFSDTCFKIVGDNLSIVQSNGIDEKLKLGDQIDFVTAPRYFGDGYVMPIVAISVNGESLLEFEEGYANLMKWYGVRGY